MPYKVLHILGSAGIEATAHSRIVAPLASRLDPKRYALHACFLGEEGPIASELSAAGARICFVKWRGHWRDVAGAWRFLREVRREKYAIIHQHVGGGLVRCIARATRSARIVLQLHGRVSEALAPKPIRIHTFGADAVIANSRAVANCVHGLPAQVVYPGVCISLDRGTDISPPRIGNHRILGTAGRLVPIKGLVFLIRAVAALVPEFPDIHLQIAGEGPDRSVIQEEVHLLHLEDCVTFLGWRRDLTALMAAWDIFVQPSLEEGFGIAALEAMAAGLPVIASAVGGLTELVEHGRTGLLVPPCDSAALAASLRVLLLNPEMRRALGAAARVRVHEKFSAERMVKAISNIYDGLLEWG